MTLKVALKKIYSQSALFSRKGGYSNFIESREIFLRDDNSDIAERYINHILKFYFEILKVIFDELLE